MATTAAPRTTRRSARGPLGRAAAAAAILMLSFAPVSAFAVGSLHEARDSESQAIQPFCEVVPRLPYICYNR